MIIEYKLRWHEINARYTARKFNQLYDRLRFDINDRISNMHFRIDLDCSCTVLDDLWIHIKHLLDINSNNAEICTQYQKSMDIIENIQLEYYELIEEIE
jgi:hypothetical protein